MKKTNQKGFAAVEGLLIAIIILLVGFIGYYVWRTQKQTDKNLNTTTQKTVQADPTSGWKSYTNPIGKFSLKYPATWVTPTNPDLCGPGFFDRALYLGPDTQSVLKCGSDDFGQIQIQSMAGEQVGAYGGEADSQYTDIVKKDVTVAGAKGQRISKVKLSPATGLGSYEKGTKVVTYIFSTQDNTYTATYVQAPVGSSPSKDVLNDFDLMIAKTLRFGE